MTSLASVDPGMLSALAGAGSAPAGIRRGIEKESLRVTPDGRLSSRPHPKGLGSALTHPHITTDFAEAQLELITDVHDDVDACIGALTDIHHYVYQHIGDELLWASSMPCLLGNPEDIQVGQYGTSNIARTKTIYRRGLGFRYGSLMQTISGIHYNFSLPEALWPSIARARRQPLDQAFVTTSYFDLIRNFRRHSWLLIYLFGASPAVCKSFVKGHPHDLETFDEGSLYLPDATSLRMGGLGYQSQAQASLHISYNSLDAYARTMLQALTQPYPAYEAIGVRNGDEYRQLNTALLQIENEFYGTIRPKRPVRPGERPLNALMNRGVEYVEVRCLDLNPFLPVGIDAQQVRFLDVFLLYCMLSSSPPDSEAQSLELSANQQLIVERGRESGLALQLDGTSVSRDSWAGHLLDECEAIARCVDRATGNGAHAEAVRTQRTLIEDPERTPSAQVLTNMRNEGIPYFRFAMNRSIAHRAHFDKHPMAAAKSRRFDAESEASLERQRSIEAADRDSLETFLARYLAIG